MAHMAKTKEKPLLMACQPRIGPVTRSQAAVNHTGSGLPPSVPLPVKTALKETAKRTTKRGTLDDNASANAVTSAPQPKRRSVLCDVTNIGCVNSSKNCTMLTKLQLGPSQGFGRALSTNKQCTKKAPKPLPPAANTNVDGLNSTGEQNEGLLAQKTKATVFVKNEGTLTLQNPEGNRDNACHEALFVERTTRDKLESAVPKAGDSAGLDIVDIDKNNVNPQMCSSFAAEIYANLMASELIRRHRSDYMEAVQQDITKGMRGVLIDWLVEVAEEYNLVSETLYLTVNIIDRFLSQTDIDRKKLQLIGVTSMLIASKYEEIRAPPVEHFCVITDETYTKAEVLEMESRVLNNLGFHLSVPTPKVFIRRFLRAAQATCNAPCMTFAHMANYLLDLTLIEYGFLKFLPSVVAASAVFLAKWTLNQSDRPWNSTLEHYTSYKSSDLQICVCALWQLQHKISNCNLKAIPEKYTQPKFDCVANRKVPKLLQSLFS